MKTKIQKCKICDEETCHDVGKKQATQPRGAYIKRTTSRCRKCGTREIKNMKKGMRTIVGQNKLGEKSE